VILRQFFLEGFMITAVSGAIGLAIALGLCSLINLAPMPERFRGMILTPGAAAMILAALTLVGIVTALLPARSAAELPPVEALRYEM
jgi:putative ABC transport system permease protein